MEKFADLLKFLADKHLIPTAASLATAILGVAFLPGAFGIANSVGKFLYGVLIFCLSFLLIQLGKYSTNGIKNLLARKEKEAAETQRKEQEAEEKERACIEELWKFVDSLSAQDKDYLRTFLANGNTAIELIGGKVYWGLLSNADFVVSTDKPIGIRRNNTMEFEGRQVYFQDVMEHTTSKLYKLNDDFYELLRFSSNKYGKISHFDTEEENG